jgi:hypothetical protein
METELFVHFAEIAGVFVGFGALISRYGTDGHAPWVGYAVFALTIWGAS